MNPKSTIALVAGVFALALAGCHDAPRKNPFDPELTPGVEVTVATSAETGTAVVDWTAYDGKQPFAEYWVLRQVQGLVSVDTLAVIPDEDLTTYTDSLMAPNTAYEYRISVANTSGFEATSDSRTSPGYQINAVELLDAEAESSGTVQLRWTRFPGPRFEGYTIERRSPTDDDFVVIGKVQSAADTLFTDANVEPDVGYVYRIVLEPPA